MAGDDVGRRARLVTLWLSLALYIAACALPALDTREVPILPNKSYRPLWGVECLLLGFLYPIYGWMTGLANGMVLFAWIAFWTRRWPRSLALKGQEKTAEARRRRERRRDDEEAAGDIPGRLSRLAGTGIKATHRAGRYAKLRRNTWREPPSGPRGAGSAGWKPNRS